MGLVKDILDEKGRQVWSIGADDSVYDAIASMADHNCGGLVVSSAASPLAGIISERDYARKVILQNKSSRETAVRVVMPSAVAYVREDTPLDHAMSLMVQKKIRHLPVVDGRDPVGMLTIGDVMMTTINKRWPWLSPPIAALV